MTDPLSPPTPPEPETFWTQIHPATMAELETWLAKRFPVNQCAYIRNAHDTYDPIHAAIRDAQREVVLTILYTWAKHNDITPTPHHKTPHATNLRPTPKTLLQKIKNALKKVL